MNIKQYILIIFVICHLCLISCDDDKVYYSTDTVYGKHIIYNYDYTTRDEQGQKKLIVMMEHVSNNSHPLKIIITIFNPLDYIVHIPYKRYPQGQDIDGVINNNIFSVHEDGNKLLYIGPLVYDAHPNAAIALNSNETYHTYIDISQYYAIHTGSHTYSILHLNSGSTLEFDTP